MNSSTLTLQTLLAASSDTRELWSIVTLLAVIGIGLVMLAVAVFRLTRPDRELLAPLEVMGRRKWRTSDPVWQRRELDAVRPPEAEPLSPARLTPEPLPGFEAGPAAHGFDDLHGDDQLAPDEPIDVGVGAGLVGLPDGEVFDSDPTPPSTEVPVIVAEEAAGDLSLAQLSIDWSPPAPEDLTLAAEAPRLGPGGAAGHTDDAIVDGSGDDSNAIALDETTDIRVDGDDVPDPDVVDDATGSVADHDEPTDTDGVGGATDAVAVDAAADDGSVDGSGGDDETTGTVR